MDIRISETATLGMRIAHPQDWYRPRIFVIFTSDNGMQLPAMVITDQMKRFKEEELVWMRCR